MDFSGKLGSPRTSTWAQSVNLTIMPMHEHERGTLMIMHGTLKNEMWLLLRSCIFMQVYSVVFGPLGDVRAEEIPQPCGNSSMWQRLSNYA